MTLCKTFLTSTILYTCSLRQSIEDLLNPSLALEAVGLSTWAVLAFSFMVDAFVLKRSIQQINENRPDGVSFWKHLKKACVKGCCIISTAHATAAALLTHFCLYHLSLLTRLILNLNAAADHVEIISSA